MDDPCPTISGSTFCWVETAGNQHQQQEKAIQPQPSNLPSRTLRETWQSLSLTAIVIRHLFGTVVIIPMMEGNSDVVTWQRCDLVRFKPWHAVERSAVVDEVEAAWADERLSVDIFTDDLTHSPDAPLDPFSL